MFFIHIYAFVASAGIESERRTANQMLRKHFQNLFSGLGGNRIGTPNRQSNVKETFSKFV
jgi:hypothetical protein